MKKHDKHILDLLSNKDNESSIIDKLSKEECEEYLFHLKEMEKVVSNSTPDYDDMWNNISSRIKTPFIRSRFFKRALASAASIIVLLSVSYLGWYIYSGINAFSGNGLAKVEKDEERNKVPVIVLDDGKTIELNIDVTGKLYDKENLSISKEGNNTVTFSVKGDKAVKPEYNTIIVPRGAEYSIKLSDGTMVQLNSESKLKYPTSFYGKNRKVWLEGEGYFRVTKNKEMPFVVNVDDMNVKVLGTTFNINSYRENNQIATTLVEGSVQVSSGDKSLILKPNQQALYKGEEMQKRDVDVTHYVSWVNGVFTFDEISLEKVMVNIERWYDVDVFFINQELKDKVFTGVIKKELSLEKILSIIERVSKIKIRINKNNVYIEKI